MTQDTTNPDQASTPATAKQTPKKAASPAKKASAAKPKATAAASAKNASSPKTKSSSAPVKAEKSTAAPAAKKSAAVKKSDADKHAAAPKSTAAKAPASKAAPLGSAAGAASDAHAEAAPKKSPDTQKNTKTEGAKIAGKKPATTGEKTATASGKRNSKPAPASEETSGAAKAAAAPKARPATPAKKSRSTDAAKHAAAGSAKSAVAETTHPANGEPAQSPAATTAENNSGPKASEAPKAQDIAAEKAEKKQSAPSSRGRGSSRAASRAPGAHGAHSADAQARGKGMSSPAVTPATPSVAQPSRNLPKPVEKQRPRTIAEADAMRAAEHAARQAAYAKAQQTKSAADKAQPAAAVRDVDSPTVSALPEGDGKPPQAAVQNGNGNGNGNGEKKSRRRGGRRRNKQAQPKDAATTLAVAPSDSETAIAPGGIAETADTDHPTPEENNAQPKNSAKSSQPDGTNGANGGNGAHGTNDANGTNRQNQKTQRADNGKNTESEEPATPTTPGTSKMFISVIAGEQVEVVLTEDGIVQEYYVEMLHQVKVKGNIYKGVVSNVDPNLQAAFISYGGTKNGFLQIDEVHPEYYQLPHDIKGRKFPLIQKALKPGQEILVQVVKEPAGTKGAFLTSYLSLPGRFLVLTPGREQIGVSRKVDNDEERTRLREMLNGLTPGPGLGVIVRTVSMGASKTSLQRDLQFLKRLWRDVRNKGKDAPTPSLVYQELDLATRAVRDYLTDTVTEVWVDDETTSEQVASFANLLFPKKTTLVKTHKDLSQTLFERFSLQKQLDQIQSREVVLPSGGRLVIDHTEALTAIDINSGKSGGKNNFEDMAYRTNMEAARMIPLQLRLRDIGGQIVADFIEMRDREHWRDVEKAIRNGMKGDRARYDVGKIGPFGMLELVRQRLGSSAISVSTEVCPCCKGTGIRRNLEWQALQALRDIHKTLRLASSQNHTSATFQTEQELAFYLLNAKRRIVQDLEKQFGISLTITSA